VRKADPMADNEQAFIRCSQGELVLPASAIELAELLDRRGTLPDLTERQKQVLTMCARGLPWKTIARQLGISQATAMGHKDAVYKNMVGFLLAVGLDSEASPADVEHALGLSPGDLNDPTGG